MIIKHPETLRSIFRIAIPSIITNITTPLLGMTDVAIAGHMGSAVFVGAIAIAGNMFNMIYWMFGFLRMGASGMTAQELGASHFDKTAIILIRALFISFIIGFLFIIFSAPLQKLMLNIMEVEYETGKLAGDYFKILIWGAPAVLGTFALTGWMLGMQNSKTPMIASIVIDIVNIIASLLFVYCYNLQLRGLAIGTLIAQWIGFTYLIIIALRKYKFTDFIKYDQIISRDLVYFFKINIHIFLRTLLLISVTIWFTRSGSQLGSDILAVNAIILQLFTLFSFFMDGFAFAGEALCGRYKGSKDSTNFFITSRELLRISFAIAVIFTALYVIFGQMIIKLLCSDRNVLLLSKEYFFWAITIPLAGYMAFSYDGIFIGITETKCMLYSMFISTAVFFLIYFLTENSLHNHGLWLAFISYLFTRGLVLKILSKKFKRRGYFH